MLPWDGSKCVDISGDFVLLNTQGRGREPSQGGRVFLGFMGQNWWLCLRAVLYHGVLEGTGTRTSAGKMSSSRTHHRVRGSQRIENTVLWPEECQ